MSEGAKQETLDAQTLLSQRYTAIMTAIPNLPSAQIDLYLHEVKWILKQLGKVGWSHPGEKEPHEREMYESVIHVEQLVFATKDALMLERAKRSIINLQGLILDGGKCGCEVSQDTIILSSMNGSSGEEQKKDEPPV